jgi:hypothetical protein
MPKNLAPPSIPQENPTACLGVFRRV